MKTNQLKIGRIPYANLFPIFYYLEKKCSRESYDFTNGVPSILNKMLREGELDISPSSSIEYLRNKDKYFLLPWFSVSSTGPIKSILLFSKLPVTELGGETVALSSESETSTTLLKIVLTEFYSLKCSYEVTAEESVEKILSSFPAVLHIGDTAMKEAKKIATRNELHVTSKKGNSTLNPSLFVYDIGDIWDKHTGLPFVYALWAVRKEVITEKEQLIKKLSEDLIDATNYARKNFSLLAGKAPQSKWLSIEELVNYWELISYNFTDRHMEGLRLFEKLAIKLNID